MVIRSLSLAALVLVPSAALAYEFYETDGGDPLRWKEKTTNVRLSTVEPSAPITNADVASAAGSGFGAWMAVDCGLPTVTVSGTTDATQGSIPSSIKGPADNIIVFIKTAEHWAQLGHGSQEIAVTVIANNPNTGEIVDADMEVNDAGFDLTMQENPLPGTVDFVATLTHEAGHFFGLDHSTVLEATMSANYDAADPSSKRTLAQDDSTAVCELYAIPFPKAKDDGCNAGGSAGWSLVGSVLMLMALRRGAPRRA